MLLDTECELLAKAVDGGLSSEEFDRFTVLVSRSPEADALFQQMLEQHRRIQALPRLTAPATLRARILANLPAPTPTPRRASLSKWWPAALAASVLVGAGTIAALVVTTAKPTRSTEEVARQPAALATVESFKPNLTGPLPLPTVTVAPIAPPFAVTPSVVEPPPVGVAVVVVMPEAPLMPAIAAPEPREENIFATGSRIELKPLKAVQVHVPVLLAMSEFHTDAGKKKLQAELNRDNTARLDLFSKNPAAYIEHLQTACRSLGASPIVEANTAERLNYPIGFTFALYLENFTAEELAALLAEATNLALAQPKSESVLGLAHIITAGVQEQKDVKELVGVEFSTGKALVKVAEARPISSDTMTKVAQALKKSEKSALLFTYLPTHYRTAALKSQEIRQFHEKRQERLPGTVPTLLVVR